MSLTGERNILTPSQVGQYLKGLMDRDRLLSGLLVRGELSNYKRYPSGHHYFTLKDGEGALRCVMFRGDAASLRFQPRNGMQVIAAGRVTVFPRDGQYQLYCVRMTPDGAGDLAVAFEQLKNRLLEEGLFAPEHKKPIPRVPGTIALVTSPAGAAVRDMLRILGARWPMAQVKVLPVRVQGEGAAEEIAAAIRWANLHQAADLIITGRGGGSMEDLWAFNEEIVARAIYDSDIPVISAVGHEPDVTIADFAADLRAATPSNAAELAVPDQNEVYASLLGLGQRLEQAARQRLLRERQGLERLAGNRVMTGPEAYFQDRRVALDFLSSRMCGGMERLLVRQRNRAEGLDKDLRRGLEKCAAGKRQRFSRLAAALDALSPLKVLGRGYAIAQKGDGGVISSVRSVQSGERFSLRLSDGSLKCIVEETEREGY